MFKVLSRYLVIRYTKFPTLDRFVKSCSMTIENAHIRVARATDNIAALLPFYCEGLGFEVLFKFQDHAGFDGVMIGHKNACYHLEFTTKKGHPVGGAPTQDNLLVFYLPDHAEYQIAIERMNHINLKAVSSFNPYWDKIGKTFEDADGYRVVLVNRAWTV